MKTQFINLNMTPSGVNPIFHISQYDVGRLLGFYVYNGSEVVDLDDYTCTVEATRTDGTQITTNVITNNNSGIFAVTATMSNVADKYNCQLVIVDGNANRVASLPFIMDVVTAALNGNDSSIYDDRSLYQQYNASMQAALANEATIRANADVLEAATRANADTTLQNNIDAEATARANAITAEKTARQNADNTLQGNINSEAATRASADSNLQSQIDQIIAPSGEAPSAAEVQNARIGSDGTVYPTLGDAIRTQNSNLKSSLHAITKLETQNIPIKWTQGSINSNNGEELSSTTKIRTQIIDISKYTSVTFNNTSDYKFRTVWLDSNGAIVKEAEYAAERTVTSVSYGFMSRYNIAAVRVVLGKTNDANIAPSEGSALTVTGVMEIETKVNQINTTLLNDYKYADTDYKQVPLTSVDFSVGHINDSGVLVGGYRPYTDFINLDNDMIIVDGTYKVNAFVYQTDGTFVSKTGWYNQIFIPYTADRKIRIMFDNSNVPNNSTSPQIDQIINSDLYIGVKRKKEYIEESVTNVLTNMAGQNGNAVNLAFITDLHVAAFGDLSLSQIEVWKRNTNGLACVDESRNIDFVVLGGDYLWNDKNTTLVRAKSAYKLLQECFYQFKEKQFALKGNHDDNSIANNSSYIVTDSERYGYLGQQYTNDVSIEYGNAEKSYGYIDFMRQKVRTIFINTVDIPSYTGQHVTGIGNNQLNFIADALNFTESGWAVIFFSHHLLINNATMNPSGDVEGYVTSTHGGDAIWGIIQSYKNKGRYSKTSTLDGYEYSVDVDYTANGSDEVIACINGHTHRDVSATQDGVLLLSTCASGYGQNAYDSTGTKITQALNTKSETSYDIYSFDRINRTIKASRYGAGQNRNWSY